MCDRETLVLYGRCKSLALVQQQQAVMRPLLEAIERAGLHPVPRELCVSATARGGRWTVVRAVGAALDQCGPGVTVVLY
jgi:hypothetical protein